MPKVHLHSPVLAYKAGDDLMKYWYQAAEGKLNPFVLVVAGLAPMIPLDDQLRPTWLFGSTVREGCDRAGYYEQGYFADSYGSPKYIVKPGCWGPVVNGNVPRRGWMAGIGGCPECNTLVGLIRRQWRRLSGGMELWGEIHTFFAGLKNEVRTCLT